MREGDGAEPLPERALSPQPNLVTPGGPAAREARVRELEAERSAARASGERVACQGGEAEIVTIEP